MTTKEDQMDRHIIAKVSNKDNNHSSNLDDKTATIPWKNSPTRTAISHTFAQILALKSASTMAVDPKEKVPSKYQKHLHLFSKATSDHLLKHKLYNYTIYLIDNPKMS